MVLSYRATEKAGFAHPKTGCFIVVGPYPGFGFLGNLGVFGQPGGVRKLAETPATSLSGGLALDLAL